MGRTQALVCIALLVLVAKYEVRAETPCSRQCPTLCQKKEKSAFQCYLFCVKHCNSKKGAAEGVKLTKEEEELLKSDNEAMLRAIEEELIKTPQHKLEGHDKDKRTFLEKPPQELKGKDSKKNDHDGMKKEEGSNKKDKSKTKEHDGQKKEGGSKKKEDSKKKEQNDKKKERDSKEQ